MSTIQLKKKKYPSLFNKLHLNNLNISNDSYHEVIDNYSDTIVKFFEKNREFKEIIPDIKKGKKILVVAHGNSIRGLIKYFDKLSDEEIVNVDIPNAIPLVYEFNENLEVIKRYYLGNEDEINKKINIIKKLEKQIDNN